MRGCYGWEEMRGNFLLMSHSFPSVRLVVLLLLVFQFLGSFGVFYGYGYRVEIVGVVAGLVSPEEGIVQGYDHLMAGQHSSAQMSMGMGWEVVSGVPEDGHVISDQPIGVGSLE